MCGTVQYTVMSVVGNRENLTEHQREYLETGLPKFVQKSRSANVYGIELRSFSDSSVNESSTVTCTWSGGEGGDDTAYARVLYFLRTSACCSDECEVYDLVCVKWFTRTRDGSAYMCPPEGHDFTWLESIKPVVVLAVPHNLELDSGRTVEDRARLKRQADVGPFSMFTVSRKSY